jgi:hypothetical protein
MEYIETNDFRTDEASDFLNKFILEKYI